MMTYNNVFFDNDTTMTARVYAIFRFLMITDRTYTYLGWIWFWFNIFEWRVPTVLTIQRHYYSQYNDDCARKKGSCDHKKYSQAHHYYTSNRQNIRKLLRPLYGFIIKLFLSSNFIFILRVHFLFSNFSDLFKDLC